MECNCEKVKKGECHWSRYPYYINGEYVEGCKLDEHRDRTEKQARIDEAV